MVNANRHVLQSMIVLATLLAAAACDGRSATPLATGAAPGTAAALAAGEVDLFIRPDGEYRIRGQDSPFRVEQLADRLGAAYSGGPASPRSLNILAYKGVVGYHVVMAVNTARENGVTQVKGIADYGDSRLSRLSWKRWEMKLDPSRARASTRDTARHSH